MNGTWKILMGIALVVIGISLLIGPGSLMGRQEYKLDKEWTVAGDELKELQILGEGRVNVVFLESTDGSQSVSVKGQVPRHVAKSINETRLEGGRLVVDLRGGNRIFPAFRFGSFWAGPGEVTVKLRPGYELSHLTVRTDAGQIRAGSIAVRTADFTSDSGKLKLADLTGGQIRVRADAGSLELANVEADSLDIRIDAGDIQASNISADTTIRLDSGNAKLDGAAGRFSIRADSGNIRLIKKDTADADIRLDSGDVYVRLPAAFAGSLDLNTAWGRIDAPETKNETQDRIQVRTDSGNIEIELEE